MSTEDREVKTEALSFRAEVRQLLDILAHSLYSEREVFLRELISNASDALNRIQFEMLTNREVLDPEAELAIHIEVDQEARTIAIRDRGIGMTREELIENLGTIAQSGARSFLQRVRQEQKEAEEENRSFATDMIGQFGVGFYSVFMVADRVTVTSRSYRLDAEAVQWEAEGGDTYTIGPGEWAERGTSITLHLKEDAHEFANAWRLRQIIKRHSDFVAFPIFMGEEQVNQQQALWRRPPREVEAGQYPSFYQQLTMDMDDPLLHMHLSTDVPVDLHAVLFVPSHRERGIIERRVEGKIKLYSHKVLIQEETRDLLPSYYRFVEGVIDSEDLPLNVSRETVQSNPVMQRIRKSLSGRLTKELNELAEKDEEKYARFWKEFGIFIKEGIATEFADRESLIKLLRFHTTHDTDQEDERLWSLDDYKRRIVENQEHIYYVLAGDLSAARLSPHLDPLAARGIEVLLLTELIDSFMLTGLREYEGMTLKNIDDADLALPGEAPPADSAISDEEFEQLRARFVAVLGERVKEVRASKVLRNSPFRLVSSAEDTTTREMQRIHQLLGQEVAQQPRIMELNRSHPLIVGLAKRAAAHADDPVVAVSAEQLFDNALLLEGIHTNPAAMVPRIQALMEAAASGTS
ncbi:MAG: molecular chaperone HtpG [Chloroflexaceae bacterium]|nr:molecular chaperone HtpG [Chloroflexaceae bacterium]